MHVCVAVGSCRHAGGVGPGFKRGDRLRSKTAYIFYNMLTKLVYEVATFDRSQGAGRQTLHRAVKMHTLSR